MATGQALRRRCVVEKIIPNREGWLARHGRTI